MCFRAFLPIPIFDRLKSSYALKLKKLILLQLAADILYDVDLLSCSKVSLWCASFAHLKFNV